MKNRKYLLPIAATGIMALALSACSSGEDAAPASDGDCSAYADYGNHDGKEISVYSTIVDLEATNLEKSWAKFEECTGATIKYEGSKEFETQIGVRAKAGNAPEHCYLPAAGPHGRPGPCRKPQASTAGSFRPRGPELVCGLEEIRHC